MANTPKKMKDPTEAALSAIQDALQVRDVDKEPETAAIRRPSPAATSADAPWPGVPDPAGSGNNSFKDDNLRRQEDPATLAVPPTTTANRSVAFCARSSAARRARPIFSPASLPASG